ncbi:ketoacyl-synthetase C-terminal extension domain-containing protein, partial [Micromonospora sp. DT233]|uniref:ketoacyl-synthetase C-terminal extension domain-containing protein n=1 Tax=Micromonospora sp. DT233 TaxID=3393432 RepID=UPI003CF25721
NIGHTQAAAGVGGVIKMVMALRHGVLPATLHVDRPSSHVDWDAGNLTLLTEQRDWPAVDRARRAAVSSFGVGGTNAHVILEQAPPAPPLPAAPQAVPLVVSARSVSALREYAGRLSPDMASALVSARSFFEHRAVVVGDPEAGLAALAAGRAAPGVVRGEAVEGLRAVFVFPGQGSQWAGMAVRLLDAEP